jgi:fumarate reductase flavoprotein subunit
VSPDQQTVVVVGGGGGGLAATISAAAHGLTVHLVEKQDHLGGMLHIANGEFSGAGSRRQAQRGIEDSAQRHFDEVLTLSHGHVDKDLAWLSVSRQGETVDWLDDHGFQFHDDCPGLIHGHEVYDVPRTYWGVDQGHSVLQVLQRELDPLVEAGRVQVHLGTTVTDLVRDGDRVVGVEVRGEHGAATITADAVVFATGGYDANPELRNRFLPDHCHSVLVGCLDHATGDGLVMAEKIGAAVSADGFFLPVMGLIPDPHRPGHAVSYREAFVEMAPAYRTPHEIWVNTDGRRFVAEDTRSPEKRERALIAQPDNTMHVIFDAGVVADAPVSLIRNPADEWSTEHFAQACRTSDWITRGDTLEELASALGVDAGNLAASVAAYNDAVGTGADELGRVTFPVRLDRGPFYAITTVAASILSRDGLAADTELRVLDASGVPIPGLYAVGEILGNNTFAGDNYVGGMSITPALTLGRILGERLAGVREADTKESTR